MKDLEVKRRAEVISLPVRIAVLQQVRLSLLSPQKPSKKWRNCFSNGLKEMNVGLLIGEGCGGSLTGEMVGSLVGEVMVHWLDMWS